MKDGENALMNFIAGGTTNQPVEIFETRYPWRIERYALRQDSGGAGKYRGGLGVERGYLVLAETLISTSADRYNVASWGIFGGKPGSRGEAILNPGTPEERRLPLKITGLRLKPNDRLTHRMPGPGGWGDPLERDIDLVRRDVVGGYVSLESARRNYGVVINPETLEIDMEATTNLREKMKRKNDLHSIR